MGEIAAYAGAIHERPLRRRLRIADAGYIVDVAVDPLQDNHDTRHTVAGGAKLALGETHELVRWAKAAWQQKRQYVTRQVRPEMLPTGRVKQLSTVILHCRAVSDGHFA